MTPARDTRRARPRPDERPDMIPEAAVEAGARGMFAEEQCDRRQKLDVEANWLGRLDDRDRAEYRRLTRAALEAAAPYVLAGPVHAYAAAGFAVCGLETGGAISRHDGYDGPARLMTTDDRFVTCEGCRR